MTGTMVLVHQRPHPAHAAFAEETGLGLHRWLRREGPYPTLWLRDLHCALAIPRGGVAVAEGGGPAGSVALARTLRRVRRAVLLAADETWARLRRGVPDPLPRTERAWWRVVARGLDGAIAVSPYVADDLRALFPRLPVRVVRPFVQPETAARLAALRPPLSGSRLLHLANEGPKNGTALVLAAWPEIRRRHPGATLDLVGADSERWGRDAPEGVRAHGRVPDLLPFLEQSDLFLLPGLGQACPVSTLEAMAAGLPALVSAETGTKDLVERVDPSLVAAPSPSAVATAASAWLDLSPAERARRSAAAREAVAGITAATQRAAFREALGGLVKGSGAEG